MTPEDFFSVLQPQQVDPELEARIRTMQEREIRDIIYFRQQVLKFAGVFCRCHPYWDRDGRHPDTADCYVHGRLIYNPLTGGWVY